VYAERIAMAESTFEVVRRVLIDSLSIDESAISLETKLSEDLGADSLDALEILMALEEEFGVEVEPSQTEAIKTVSDLVALIDTLKA